MTDTPLTLHDHAPPPHPAKTIDEHHAERHAGQNWYARGKEWLAVKISSALGTMECAAIFIALAVYGFPQHPTPAQLVQWISQTLIQLTALSILGLGQQVAGRVTDYISQAIYQATQNILHTDEQSAQHLAAQDTELVKQSAEIQGIQQQIAELRAFVADRDDALAALLAPILARLDTIDSHTTPAPQKKPFARFRQK